MTQTAKLFIGNASLAPTMSPRTRPPRCGDGHHTSRARRRRRLAAALALLCAALRGPQRAGAYVTSGLPARTHRAFLRKLTDDLVAAAPGTLTASEVSGAPRLMSAWAGLPDPLAVEGLLKRLIEERRAGNAAAIARTDDYNAAMRSWAASGEGGAAASRVEQILLSMQQMYAAGDEDVRPNPESFRIAIEAWVNAGDEPSGLGRAQHVLDWMTKLYLSSANDLAAPNSSCFLPILRGWANSGRIEAPVVTEQLIMWMQHLQMEKGIEGPNTACFNLVISSWLQSKDVAAEKKIRQVFEYMDKCRRLGSPDIKPDAATYNMAIASIAPAVKERHDRGGARRADRLLARLEAGYRAGDVVLGPDTIVYNTVIDYWAKAQTHRGHYLKARAVLDRQVATHAEGVHRCRPDAIGYTAVVAAAASTAGSRPERRRAYNVARATFQEAQAGGERTRPNAVTYGLMLKAVGRLLPKGRERDRHARALFRQCTAEGCLGEMAHRRLLGAASKKLLRKLNVGRDYARLPSEWKAHAYESAASSKKPSRRGKKAVKGELRP